MQNGHEIQTQSDLLMCRIHEFFKCPVYLKRMIDVLTGKSVLSLRIIDWFVTNYSKKHDTIYMIKTDDTDHVYGLSEACELVDGVAYTKFIVFLEYKSQLKAYSKKQFDSFCRGERIKYMYEEGGQPYEVETTVGQLNFFRWAISNNLFAYIERFYGEIESDMNETVYCKRLKRKSGMQKRIMYQADNGPCHIKQLRSVIYFQ